MEKQSPVQRIWEPGKERRRKHIAAVLLAVVGVIGGMVPCFVAAKIIVLLIARVWDVDSGNVSIGGVDERDYTLDRHGVPKRVSFCRHH